MFIKLRETIKKKFSKYMKNRKLIKKLGEKFETIWESDKFDVQILKKKGDYEFIKALVSGDEVISQFGEHVIDICQIYNYLYIILDGDIYYKEQGEDELKQISSGHDAKEFCTIGRRDKSIICYENFSGKAVAFDYSENMIFQWTSIREDIDGSTKFELYENGNYSYKCKKDGIWYQSDGFELPVLTNSLESIFFNKIITEEKWKIFDFENGEIKPLKGMEFDTIQKLEIGMAPEYYNYICTNEGKTYLVKKDSGNAGEDTVVKTEIPGRYIKKISGVSNDKIYNNLYEVVNGDEAHVVLYNPETHKFSEITTYKGKDLEFSIDLKLNKETGEFKYVLLVHQNDETDSTSEKD